MSALSPATVAIVNWNGRHLLEACLPSVYGLDYPADALECVVVDNGSTDGSLDWLRTCWPQVRVVAHPDNRGFAAAANDAADAAQGRVVAFLNNDCRVEPTWLRRLVETLDGEGVAAAGSCMVDWSGERIDFDGAAMNFHGHGSNRGFGRPYVATARAPEPALFACGGAMAVDRDRFLATGGFDADYFAYFEDVDLGWRLWVEGERVLYVPDAVAFHRHRGSGMDPTRWRFLLERNALASLFKNYDDSNLEVVLPAARALLAARAQLAIGTAEGDAFGAAERAFDERRAALRAARARIQTRRRRPDHEILPLFREPFRPSAFGRAYWATQRRIVAEHGLARVFGAATVAGAEGLADFVDELQGRVEELTAHLAGPREA